MKKSKNEFRNQAKSIYKNLSNDYKNRASSEITDLLCKEQLFKDASSILLYISTSDEPSTIDISTQILLLNKKLYIPVCTEGNKLRISQITKDTQFTENIYGIKEPLNPIFSEITPDLIIMPCVAVSMGKTRLGHGKGYYDRYLSTVKTNTICLCFSKLIFDELPQDNYDIKPDYIITENGIIF